MSGLRAGLGGALVLLGACAHPAVVDMANGQHTLTVTADSGGVGGSHEAAIEAANEFCDHSGRQPVIASFYDKAELGPQGEHTSTLIFSCGAPRALRF
jgi:hypothetical protein